MPCCTMLGKAAFVLCGFIVAAFAVIVPDIAARLRRSARWIHNNWGGVRTTGEGE